MTFEGFSAWFQETSNRTHSDGPSTLLSDVPSALLSNRGIEVDTKHEMSDVELYKWYAKMVDSSGLSFDFSEDADEGGKHGEVGEAEQLVRSRRASVSLVCAYLMHCCIRAG